MQLGDVWNANGDVKQVGAFASVLKLAFRLLTSLYLCTSGVTIKARKKSVTTLLIIYVVEYY